MGIDAFRAPVDDEVNRRPQADPPPEEQTAESLARGQMRLPSAAERIEAHRQSRLATDRAYAELIGEEIAKGHAFDKHVIDRGEFPGVTTRGQFASVIQGAVMDGESRALSGGRTAYWSDGTVVIRNPGTADSGTAFRPTNGHDYFLGLH